MEGIVWGCLPSAAKMTGAVEYLEIKPRANGSGSGWLSGKGQLGIWVEEQGGFRTAGTEWKQLAFGARHMQGAAVL